ncbi:hypothetical protein QBC46DRAFT_346924 [Diplogelasinospora grovesii]|uniref:Uncharacterized protein n=1 Tax=Diplogelasinospora grovesii TaxID=303347 RepID=A0AAN6MX65_9PEZI|nr:hypothetical protein QBC46DRAFT_346924 [Diplogelasinospora grovesii]
MSRFPATPENVLGELKKLYWAAVQKEVQNMIEFHNVLKTAHGLPQAPASLECDNFKKMFDIWVEQIVTQDSDGPSPRPKLFGVSCSECQRLIRSNVFYECICMKGCKSNVYYEYSVEGWQLCELETASEGSEFSISRRRSRYRLCAPCKNTTDSCEGGHHLGRVRYKDPAIDGMDIRRLRIQLSEFGNKHDPSKEEKQVLGHQGAPRMSRREKSVIKALKNLQAKWPTTQLALRNLAPAGNFHLSLMFGPLTFESGLPK